jgi:pyruvate dehydrogenase E1 component alpha subunit
MDGNDILAVYAAAKEAVDRARAGQGPTLIECVTYRMAMHTTADDPKRYRTEEEVDKWRERDPIVRYQKYLVDKGLLSEDKIAGIEAEVLEEIQAAVDGAEEQMKALGDPIDMFEHAYARMPAYLKEQKEAFAREVAAITEEENSG